VGGPARVALVGPDQHRARRHPAGLGLGDAALQVDQVEGEPGGAAEQALDVLGFRSPGTWTRMRSAPWRWIEASRVPSSSMRRRTTSIDWSTAALARLSRASSASGIVTRPPGSAATSNSRAIPAPKPTAGRRGFSSASFASAAASCAGSTRVNTTRSRSTPRPR
jgi:hypothetical protein